MLQASPDPDAAPHQDADLLSAGERAYERIRSDIVVGRLPPGQRLTLEKLRARYGVGVGTLREIFSRLTPEGLVTAEGQRGFHVAPCSADNLREVAALRLLLEKSAMARSFAAGDVEWEGRLVAAHHKLARVEQGLLAGQDGDAERWKRFDWEFHQALVSACGSRALLDLHAGVYDRYLRYQMVFVIFRGAVAADEHRALLDAALRRDAPAAQEILERHVAGCLDFAFSRKLL